MHQSSILDLEATAAKTIRFSNLKAQKRKEPSATSEHGCALVPGTELIWKVRGILNLANLMKSMIPKFISIMNVVLCVPSSNVTDLVTDLFFMGLDTLRAKDKTVCFVHPKDSSQPARKRQDMPTKFQIIHKEWAVFDQGITRFKNDIKEGRRQTYNLLIWFGGNKPTEQILQACTLEWEADQENGGTVKMGYKNSKHYALQ